jgi:hypothetical protein
LRRADDRINTVGVVGQVILCVVLLALHLPTLLIAVAFVTPPYVGVGYGLIRFGAALGYLLGYLTTSVSVLLALVAVIVSRQVRRNPFVWIITGVGIAAAVWVPMR